MMEFDDDEFELLQYMITDKMFDDMYHYPNDWTKTEHDAAARLMRKLAEETKRRAHRG